jgi:hypothetical protein
MELVNGDDARDFLEIMLDVLDIDAYRRTLEEDLSALPY